MDSKTKKTLLIASAIFALIVTMYMFHIFSSSKELEFRSGTYYCKMNITSENTPKVFSWDLGISKNNIKNDIVENESNSQILEQFRQTVNQISSKRFSLLLFLLYLIYIMIIFLSIEKDSKLYKKESDKKILQLLITLMIIFLICLITNASIELNGLSKHAFYYFSLIK
ncbi:MAG TPA: hypothetical protein VFC84_05695 [Desulfosporosinus sp.]|nr:hypothetical protein [Desulfosporosinus sp.]